MKENKEKNLQWNEILYRLIYASLLFLIVIFAGAFLLGIDKTGFFHVFLGLLLIGVLVILKYTALRGRILCCMGVLAVSVVVVVFVTPEGIVTYCGNFVGWLFGTGTWIEEQRTLYEVTFSGLIGVLCYVLQTILERIPRVKYILTILLFAALLVCMFAKWKMNHMGTIFALWYVILNYIEWTKVNWKKERSRDMKSYMLWILPFCVIYLLILSFMPFPKKPYDWKFVKTAYKNIKESVTALAEDITNGNREGFNLNFAGFSDDKGAINGDIQDSKIQMMTVKGEDTLKTNVYLTGKIYDTFNGKKWSAKAGETPGEQMMDSFETLYAIRRYEGESYELMTKSKINVEYRFLHSGYLFAPVKTLKIVSDKRFKQNTDIQFKRKQGYGTTYSVNFMQLNLDQPELYEYMESDIPEKENAWSKIMAEYYDDRARKDRPTLDDLQKHRDHIYETYVGDVILSEEGQAELNRMTEGCESQIDKLKAIERELSSYTYTKTPGAVPSDVKTDADFVDYILEKKEGYCSYYATVFVLLARAEGIPARYVEGFSVKTKSDQEVMVETSDAHAWPEVYIDGFGWVPFEPTPGYGELRYTPWAIGGKEYTDTAGKQYEYKPNTVHQQNLEEREKKRLEKQQRDMQNMQRLADISKKVMLIVMVLLILFFLMEKMVRRYRYRHMSREEQFCVEVKKNLWLLKKLHIEREEQETLQELKNHSEKEIPGVSVRFLNSFEAYLYGKETVTIEMLEGALQEQNAIWEYIKEHRGWIRYLFWQCSQK